MIAVIFESWPKAGRKESYVDMAAALMPIVQDVEGFISVERFESVSEPGKMVALSFWRDEAAVAQWRTMMEHRRVQQASRAAIFREYRLRVAHVARDYTMTDRNEVPTDSEDTIHDQD